MRYFNSDRIRNIVEIIDSLFSILEKLWDFATWLSFWLGYSNGAHSIQDGIADFVTWLGF